MERSWKLLCRTKAASFIHSMEAVGTKTIILPSTKQLRLHVNDSVPFHRSSEPSLLHHSGTGEEHERARLLDT